MLMLSYFWKNIWLAIKKKKKKIQHIFQACTQTEMALHNDGHILNLPSENEYRHNKLFSDDTKAMIISL